LTQGSARFTSLALGYYLPGFQPFQFEPPHVGCYGYHFAIRKMLSDRSDIRYEYNESER